MKNLFILLLIAFFFSSCTLKKIQKHHGVHVLDKKQSKLIINKSNKNDILKLLGSPSTKSAFDDNLWIYIERKKNNSTLRRFGKEEIIVNNVLLLTINSKGLLQKKEFYNLENMKDIEFTKSITDTPYRKNTFMIEFLSSLRQKINDPLGKRKK